MSSGEFRVGVDFGTSNTVAVLGWPDGRQAPLLFDGTPVLPSAVYAAAEMLLVGADALHSAAARPEALEPAPKRRIDEELVLLGVREVPVVDLIAAILTRVWVEASRVAGAPVVAVTMTYPAAWGPRRRAILTEAAARAGFDPPHLVPEPVAAAIQLGRLSSVPVGGHLLVYDLGAGTFDASVLRRTATGFQVLASDGLSDTGGLDVDAAVVAHLGATYAASDPRAWQQLTHPADTTQRRAYRRLWDDVRRAKEMLSRASSTSVYLPLLDIDAPLGREQLEQLARPVVTRTITTTVAVLRDAGLNDAQLNAVYLVGGASRLPLAGTLLHQALRIPPTTVEQPELVVAAGSLHPQAQPPPPSPAAAPVPQGGLPPVTPATQSAAPTPVPPQSPPESPPAPSQPAPARPPAAPSRPRRWRRRVLWALAVILLAGSGAAAVRFTGLFAGSPGCGKRVGVLAPLTGSWAVMGDELRDGAQLAVQQYNTRHPTCRVSMPVYDTQHSIAAALADTSLLGVVGPLLSSEAASLGADLDAVALPMITPSATDPALSAKGWSTFHRIIATDADQGAAASRYLATTLHATRVYVLDDGSAYGRGTARQASLSLGAKVAGSGSLPPDQAQYARLLAAITPLKVNAIYFGGTAADAPAVLHTLHTIGIRVPVIGPDALHDPALPQAAGTDADGVAVTCLCAGTPPDSFGTDPQQAYAYDAANMLLGGVGTGHTTRSQMLTYLGGCRTDGVMGHYQFQPDGELATVQVAILTVTHGNFTGTTTIQVT